MILRLGHGSPRQRNLKLPAVLHQRQHRQIGGRKFGHGALQCLGGNVFLFATDLTQSVRRAQRFDPFFVITESGQNDVGPAAYARCSVGGIGLRS